MSRKDTQIYSTSSNITTTTDCMAEVWFDDGTLHVEDLESGQKSPFMQIAVHRNPKDARKLAGHLIAWADERNPKAEGAIKIAYIERLLISGLGECFVVRAELKGSIGIGQLIETFEGMRHRVICIQSCASASRIGLVAKEVTP